MFQNRVIPCLLLHDHGLVKTVKFHSPTYIGDPLNAVKIFNEKEVNELVFLDIDSWQPGFTIKFDVLKEIASECFMPLAYGGGIATLEDIQRLFAIGFEKIILNTAAITNPELVTDAAQQFGSQSILVAIDVKKSWTGKYIVHSHGGRSKSKLEAHEHAQEMERLGAGELIINSIDRDGTMTGYDLNLLQSITSRVQAPVVALGGAGSTDDLRSAIQHGGASAAAAGSIFVFHGPHRSVLISYPDSEEIERINT